VLKLLWQFCRLLLQGESGFYLWFFQEFNWRFKNNRDRKAQFYAEPLSLLTVRAVLPHTSFPAPRETLVFLTVCFGPNHYRSTIVVPGGKHSDIG